MRYGLHFVRYAKEGLQDKTSIRWGRCQSERSHCNLIFRTVGTFMRILKKKLLPLNKGAHFPDIGDHASDTVVQMDLIIIAIELNIYFDFEVKVNISECSAVGACEIRRFEKFLVLVLDYLFDKNMNMTKNHHRKYGVGVSFHLRQRILPS